MKLSYLDVLRQEVELAILKGDKKFNIPSNDLLEMMDDLEDAYDEIAEMGAEINDLSDRIDELATAHDELAAKTSKN